MTSVQQEESLWQDYRMQLVRFVRRRVEDGDTAEDIVHDVLVRAFRRRGSLRSEDKFEQWLYQITRNAVIDHYRARKPTDAIPADLVAADEAGSRNARQELASCMAPLIDSLPDHYREALVLSEIQGLTQQETASRLGLSLSGAKSRVQRGRRLLEERILDCCRLEFDGRGSLVDYESRRDCAAEAPRERADCGGC